MPVFASHPRYGQKAEKRNPGFLDAQLFNDLVLTPFREAQFQGHTGPFLFEFQRHDLSVVEFTSQPDNLFKQLPTEFRYAIEVRNAGFLGSQYRKVLEDHSVAHVYNHWSYMPSLADQHKRLHETFTAPFTLLRLLTPSKMSYAEAKQRAAPYTKIVAKLPEMRRDAVAPMRQSITQKTVT